jgi:hypothetical protein
MDLARFTVVDLGRLTQVHAHRDHRVFFDDHAFHDFRAGADEAVVLDDHRVGLQRLQHAADAHATRQVNVLADLGARTDGGPGVDHRAFVHVGADVHVRRHQHGVLRDERTAAGHGRRHHAETGAGKVFLAPVGELGRHLVVELGKAAGAHRRVVFQAERQQHGLLDPLVDDPVAALLLGDAQRAGVQLRDHVGHGFADIVRRGLRRQAGAVFPGLVDQGLQSLRHDGVLSGDLCERGGAGGSCPGARAFDR